MARRRPRRMAGPFAVTTPDNVLVRWRMALGRSAESRVQDALTEKQRRIDGALEFVYGRGIAQRRLRATGRAKAAGSLDSAQLALPRWIGEMRALFPASVFEEVQGHALDRFGMAELLSDPEALTKLEPNRDLMKALLAFKGRLDPRVAERARAIVARVIDELVQKLKPKIERALCGAPNRHARAAVKSAAHFDIARTVRANLKNYDPGRGVLIADTLVFTTRQRRKLPWTVILAVDQSGSMLDNLIHASVMAAILSGMPSVVTRFIVFDTSIVDLTDRLSDPIELLFSVQLGGGTLIAPALAYCESLVTEPSRTVVALVSDFDEGGPVSDLLRVVKRLAAAKVTTIGIAALDGNAAPAYNRDVAERLAGAGMKIASMTPDRFAEWLSGIMR